MSKRFNPSKLVLILLIPLLTLILSAYMTAFNENYYENQFEKYSIYQKFDLTMQQLNNVNHELLDYLKHGQGSINVSVDQFFNQKETVHLTEVKALVQGALILFYFFLTIFILLSIIVYFKNTKAFFTNMAVITASGSILNILATIVCTTLIFINFDSFFTKFHLAIFETNTWLLNPATDNLIKMFPEPFFYNITARIIATSMIISVILAIVSIYFYKLFKKQQHTAYTFHRQS